MDQQEESVEMRGFRLGLPEGFVELPIDDFYDHPVSERLPESIATLFGLSVHDADVASATQAFNGLGMMIGDAGIDYSAIAFYKSPDDPSRPIMVTVCGTAMQSDHRNKSEAVKNVIEAHKYKDCQDLSEIRLPAGPAAVVVTEEQNVLVVDEVPTRVLTRQLTAWVPDPEGTTIGVVSVMTNSFQDWEHVCGLGLDIFDSFGWEPRSA